MKITCIGDSLTEGDYGIFQKRGIANVQKLNYPYYLGKLLKAEVINCGKCGFNATQYLAYYKTGAVNVADSDLIIVMLGTNGGLNKEKVTQGNADYEMLIDLLKKEAPQAKVIVCTPPHATVDKNMSNYGNAQQVQKAVEFVRDFAERTGTLCIDLASCKLFVDENEALMQPNDGLHYTEVGYGIMALYIRDAIKDMNIIGIE